MARPLRFIPPAAMVEVTVRTVQSRFLLRPSAELNALILGVLGRALSMYDVKLHAFAVMSNHVHFLASPRDAGQLAAFMRHVNRNISEEAGRLHAWKGPLWERRYRAIPITDEASQVARLRYVLAQGCKEGLVSRPGDWPGLHCVRALVSGAVLTGIWRDRTAAYEASRRGERPAPGDYDVVYQVPLAPLPCWRDLTAAEHRQRCADLIADIERETARTNRELGRRPPGPAHVLAQHPHDGPRFSNRSRAPLVHAATGAARRRFRAAYRAFVDAFRAAAECLRANPPAIKFPVGSFPPPTPFVTPAHSAAIT